MDAAEVMVAVKPVTTTDKTKQISILFLIFSPSVINFFIVFLLLKNC